MNNYAIIADDIPYVRSLHLQLLQHFAPNARFAEVANGRELIELVEKESPDLVVTDLTMPGVNGIEASRSLRQAGYEGPIVMISGEGKREAEALEAGVTDFYVKDVATITGVLEQIAHNYLS